MDIERAQEFLEFKDNDPAVLRSHYSDDDEYLRIIFGLLEVKPKRAKNRAAKLIAQICAEMPRDLQVYFEHVVWMAKSDESVLRWNGLIALGELAGTEVGKDRCPKLVPFLLAKYLRDDSMVTAGHAITCLGRVGAASPATSAKVTDLLLGVRSGPHGSDCTRILEGKAVAALAEMQAAGNLAGSAEVRAFLEDQRFSTTKAAAAGAERLLKQL